jgi:hypothetical protein
MRFQWIARNFDSRFYGGDSIVDDHSNRDTTQPHSDHFPDADRCIGDPGAQPKAEKIEENNNENKGDDSDDGEADEIKRFHGGQLIR